LASTGSTWLPSLSDVLVARNTPLSSSAETEDAPTLWLAITFTSAADAVIPAQIPTTVAIKSQFEYFIVFAPWV